MRTRTYFILFVLLAVMFTAILDATLSLAQETPTDAPPTEAPEVVVEATDEAEAPVSVDVTVNMPDTTPVVEPAPVVLERESDLAKIVIVGLFLLLLAALWVALQFGLKLRDMIPAPLIPIIEAGVDAGLNQLQTAADRTPSQADNELLIEIRELKSLLFQRLREPIESHPSAVPVAPPTTEADAIAQARQETNDAVLR